MYVVPDHWQLKDCMVVAYLTKCKFMLSNEEFKNHHEYDQKNWERLYDELIKQPCIYNYTSDDGGDPEHKSIMKNIPLTGRLYYFSKKAYRMVPELDDFARKYTGKRYICMN